MNTSEAKPKPVRRDDRPLKLNASGKYDKIPADLAQEMPADPESLTLIPCKNCGRKFKEDRLAKHEEVCKTAAENSKMRGVFATSVKK
jgi:hypothetical protein